MLVYAIRLIFRVVFVPFGQHFQIVSSSGRLLRNCMNFQRVWYEWVTFQLDEATETDTWQILAE